MCLGVNLDSIYNHEDSNNNQENDSDNIKIKSKKIITRQKMIIDHDSNSNLLSTIIE